MPAPTPSYTWSDDGPAVTVRVPLPPATSNVAVDARSGLEVSAGGAAIVRIRQLAATVDVPRVTHVVSDGVAVIKLPKLAPEEAWTALEAEEGEAAPPPPPADGPAAALEERAAVEALLTAARTGHVEELKKCAARYSQDAGGVGAVRDGRGRTALHFAAAGHPAAVAWLVDEAGVSVNALDEGGETPLAVAAAGGEAGAARALLERGADPSLAGPGGVPPICRAAGSGVVDAVRALLDAGADVAAPSEAGPPLVWAAGSGDAAVVRALLAAGAPADARGPDGVTAVLIAAATENEDSVSALVDAGADVTVAAEGGVTPLHAAAEVGAAAVVDALLKGGADPAAEDGEGARPVEAAAAAGFRDVVAALLPLTPRRPGHEGDWSVDAVMEACKRSEEEGHAHAHGDGCGCGGPPPAAPVPVPAPTSPDAAAAAAAARAGDEAFVGGDHAAAAAHYTRSLRHATGAARVWADRAAARLRLGAPSDALQDARIARSVDPRLGRAWYREGVAARELGLWEDAAHAFFEGFRVDPGNGEMAAGFQDAVARGRAEHAARAQGKKG